MFRFLNALNLIDIPTTSATPGLILPATTAPAPARSRRLGISDSMVRLVGLEDPADIIEDLDQALAA